MALTTVLWGIALLSIIAVSFLSSSSASYRIARNSTEIAQAEATADAAIARAVLSLFDSRPDKRWRIDGVAQGVEIGGKPVRITIQDELGKIDINHADAALLVRLFRSAGLDGQAADNQVDKILVWRGSNVSGRFPSIRDKNYRTNGQPYRRRNGSFQSTDELKLVIGMTPELFRRVEPALTVYSGHQFFDPRTAPREALLALPTMDPGKVASVLAARAQAAPQSVSPALASLIGRAVAIRTEIESSAVQTYEVVVRLTDNPQEPYWVLNWKIK